jgi:hypothetical protein
MRSSISEGGNRSEFELLKSSNSSSVYRETGDVQLTVIRGLDSRRAAVPASTSFAFKPVDEVNDGAGFLA